MGENRLQEVKLGPSEYVSEFLADVSAFRENGIA